MQTNASREAIKYSIWILDYTAKFCHCKPQLLMCKNAGDFKSVPKKTPSGNELIREADQTFINEEDEKNGLDPSATKRRCC